MPYWSSSRVGAVPTNNNHHQHKKNGGHAATQRSMRKGITMEDLKKQTALRLAYEQGHDGSVSSAPPSTTTTAHPAPHHHHHSAAPTMTTPVRSSSHAYESRRTPVSTPDRSHSYNAANSTNGGMTNGPGMVHSRHGTTTPPPNYRREERMQAPKCNNYSVPVSTTTTTVTAATPVATFSASRSVDSATEKGANSKLPHGLTVYELKEMTKARLEAQAGTVVPSTVQVNNNSASDPMAPSPIPSYSRHGTVRSPYPIDTTQEAWESASVSTTASDYPGSESVYSNMNGAASFNGDDLVPFARSSSYPRSSNGNGALSYPDQLHPAHSHGNGGLPPPMVATGAYFPPESVSNNGTVGYVPNRRRAATLSPRPGFSILENRPNLYGGQNLNVPSDLSTPGLTHPSQLPAGLQGPRRIPSRSRSAFHPDVTLPWGSSTSSHGVATTPESNRNRTSSAASLPTMSCTSDEFLLESNRPRFASQFGSVAEDVAPSVTGLSDVFRSGSMDAQSQQTLNTNHTNNHNHTGGSYGGGPGIHTSHSMGLSSLGSFGEPRLRAATDFSGSEVLASPSSSSVEVQHQPTDMRHRASTWGHPSSLDLFCGQDLSQDLASILKLSGAEPSDDDKDNNNHNKIGGDDNLVEL